MGQTPVNQPDVAVTSGAYSSRRSSQLSAVSAESGASSGSEPPPPDDDQLVGSILSNTYKVLRILGEGGMGRVYEAQHTRISGKRFAIKALHPEFARRKDVLTRFHREVEAAASIASPHVVGVYDVDQADDGRPFFVSELLTGMELGDYLQQNGRIAVGFTVKIVRQICRALIAAHDKGVVHRDMKPENVFLSGDVYEPVVKVIDFGISRLEGQAGNTLTKTGVVMGTPSYMAPEQAKGLKVDYRVDVYSVGAILYQCVTGRIPFDRADATATLAAVLTEDPEPPRSIAPDLSQHLELVIQKAMAREPEDRYQSMEELDLALAPYDEEEMMLLEATGAGRAPRLTQASTTDAVRAAREVSDARSQLVILGAIAAIGSIAALFGIIAGVVRLARGGGPLTTTEALVVSLVLAAALSTPAVLLIRHVQKTTWTNIARVVELVRRLREPVLAAIATYGGMALIVRTIEALVVRSTVGVAWPMWDFLLPLVALLVALGAWLGRRSEAGQSSLLDRLGPAGSTSVVVATLLITVIGAQALREDGAANILEADADKQEQDDSDSDREEKAAGDDERKKEPVDEKAAIAAWNETRKAIKVGNWGAAVDGAEKLIEADPNAPSDPHVRNGFVDLAVKACLREGPLCDRLLAVLTEEAGPSGPDVLYEVLTTKGGTNAHRHATRLLADEDVRERGSEGMQIAYALRTAPDCESKKALFDRVAERGDHRALRELEILKSGRQCRSVGCCLGNDEALKKTVRAILARQGD